MTYLTIKKENNKLTLANNQLKVYCVGQKTKEVHVNYLS